MSLDRFIAPLAAERDGDLMLCHSFGVAYQADRSHLVTYADDYFAKCRRNDRSPIAGALNAARVEFVNRHLGTNGVLDVGIGGGAFVQSRGRTWGHDVNPRALEWLRRSGRLAPNLTDFAGFTFWDVLEHCPDPGEYLDRIGLHRFLFVSIPIFEKIFEIRSSRHYRPGEHLYYWTDFGFRQWLERHGFLILETSSFESELGRDSIRSYAAKRILWPRPPFDLPASME